MFHHTNHYGPNTSLERLYPTLEPSIYTQQQNSLAKTQTSYPGPQEMASSPSSESSLRSTINTALHRTIFENNDDDDPATTTLLYDLLYGNTNTNIAVHELIVSATGTKDADDFFSSLSIQILYLAAEYPFLQPQLQALVERTIASPNAAASDFTSSMAVTLSDTIQSLHAQLFEQKNKTKDHIDDYINLHRFTARIIAISTPTADMADRAVSGIDDALYVLSTALEAHPDSHNFLDAVVGAAAQYVIHAGSALFEVCRKRSALLPS